MKEIDKKDISIFLIIIDLKAVYEKDAAF